VGMNRVQALMQDLRFVLDDHREAYCRHSRSPCTVIYARQSSLQDELVQSIPKHL
jgi:hypothetical protein